MAALDLPHKSLVDDAPQIRRLNRLPIVVAVLIAILFFAVILYGLSIRGLYFGDRDGIGDASNSPPARDFADRLKRGVGDGVIDAPAEPVLFRPQPAPVQQPSSNPFKPEPATTPAVTKAHREELEPEHVWRARLRREQEEQYIREQHRQRMARLQADDAAYDSPITVQIDKDNTSGGNEEIGAQGTGARPDENRATDLYAALRGGLAGQTDPNGQSSKQDFFNQDLKDIGYLPNPVVGQKSPYELKRGSVIPATLVTGINSDLPGRITAQVSQNVYDSATGRHLLIPQGAKLFGRYDSEVTFGQKRVLVAWTDIIFPNGSTLQIGGMAGTDAQGYGGFKDRVNNHYLRVFGSAALVAVIGAGIDMAAPQDRDTSGAENSGESAARRSFAETFGRVVERTISKNIDVQPTLEIRPGYRFNVLVDQDVVFPGRYGAI